jgi:hypothetical protein
MSQNNPFSTTAQHGYVFVERPVDSKPRVYYNRVRDPSSTLNAQAPTYFCEGPGFVIEGSMPTKPEDHNIDHDTVVLQFDKTADSSTELDATVEHTLIPQPTYLTPRQLELVKEHLKWIRFDIQQQEIFRFNGEIASDDSDQAFYDTRCNYAVRILVGALHQHNLATWGEHWRQD